MGDPRIKILGIVNPTHQVKRPSFINIGDFAIWDFVCRVRTQSVDKVT